MKDIFYYKNSRTILKFLTGFIGLMLSPITWWNDPFVNIPISYLAASLIARFVPNVFSLSLVIFYWLSNILGILLLYKGGKGFIESRKISRQKQIVTILVYTLIILLLSIFEILRPIFK